MRTTAYRMLVVGLIAAPALTGCSGRTDGPTDTTVRFLTAATADPATACDLLAPATAKKIAEQEGTPCAAALSSADLPEPGRVLTAHVAINRAQVVLDTDTVFLARLPDGWRVVAAGCRSQGPEQPYDCTVEEG